MLGFLSIGLRVLGILPSVIVGAEHLFGAGKGSDKKSNVMGLITALLAGADTLAPNSGIDFGKVNDAMGKVVDGIVEIFNVTGVFKKA